MNLWTKRSPLLDDVAGEPARLMSGGKGGSDGGTTTTVQKSEPWAEQKPFLTFGFNQAKQQYLTQQPQYYPGTTVAPFSAETQAALGLEAARALAGSPVSAAAKDQVAATLAGDYLDAGNPYFAGMMQNVGQAIRPQFDAQFAKAGRYGSGAHAAAFADALARAGTEAAYQNWGQERDNMLKAASAAPPLAADDYRDIAMLADVGGQREKMSQATINDAVARYNFEQQLPYNSLAQYLNLIQGNFGGTSTTTRTEQMPRGASSVLAAASTGAGIGNTIAPGGTGAGIGAGLGLLAGLLF